MANPVPLGGALAKETTMMTSCVGCESGDPVARLYRHLPSGDVFGYCVSCADEIDCGWADRASDFEGVPCALCAAAQAIEIPPAVELAPEADGSPAPACRDCADMLRGEAPMV